MLYLLLVFATLLSSATAQNQNSVVSTVLCDTYLSHKQVNFQIDIHFKNGRRITATFTGDNSKKLTKSLDEKVPHANINFVKISSNMQEICFYALVIDTVSFIDMPMVFKASCERGDDLCQQFDSKINPARVCQHILTNFLKKKHVIAPDAEPDYSGKEFETPEYDIRGDMAQAAITIAEGLAEGARQFDKNREKMSKVPKIANVLGTLAKFLKAAGPLLNTFGGVTSILTINLTPNPFDEMVGYMKKEFDELHRRLNRMTKELVNEIVKQGALNRMANKLDIIRYSMRDYGTMINSLSKHNVCGVDELLENSKVKVFWRDYIARDTKQRLVDLIEVEGGGILGTPSLLDPYMRAHCISSPLKVKRFMKEVTIYAIHGTRAYMAYKTLECLKNGQDNCEINIIDLENDFAKKLYLLLNKANALRIAVDDSAKGLYLEFKEKYFEMKKQSEEKYRGNRRGLYSKKQKSFFFNAFRDEFFHRLFDRDGWARSCIIDANDRLVLALVAQSNATLEAQDFLPWNLDGRSIRFDHADMKVKNTPNADALKKFPEDASDIKCDDSLPMRDISPCRAKASGTKPNPAQDPSDRIVYLEYNPKVDRLHVTIKSLDVYNKPDYDTGSKPIKLGCWYGESDYGKYECPRKKGMIRFLEKPKVRYFAIIDCNSD